MDRIKVLMVAIVLLLFLSMFAIGGRFILNNRSKEGFGIHLLENDIPVISDRDIVSYNKSSHEIKLTEVGGEKINALKMPVYGRPFVTKVNEKEIYNGSFWTPISSMSCSGVVIQIVIRNDAIKIEMGYPTSQFEEKDPRDDPRILDYFQRVGKLVQ